MPAIKLNISLDEEVVRTLRRRAIEARKSTSRYLAELIQADARRWQDELAAEGYQLLSADTASFAAAAWPLANEVWSGWEEAADAGKPGEASGQTAGETDEPQTEAR